MRRAIEEILAAPRTPYEGNTALALEILEVISREMARTAGEVETEYLAALAAGDLRAIEDRGEVYNDFTWASSAAQQVANLLSYYA